MSTLDTTDESPSGTESRPATRDLPQLGLALGLGVVGAWTIYDASTLRVGFGDPVGPRAFPYVVGGVLVGLAVLLALATLRGDIPQAEGGEDVDLTHPADWRTVALLVGVLAFTAATVDLLGWAISGAILFAGSTWCLGSRTWVRDLAIGTVLSVGSWYAFYVGLGIPLTPGVLDGVL